MAGIWKDYMLSYYKSHPSSVLAFTPPQTPLDRQPESGIVATLDNGINQIENSAENEAKKLDEGLQKSMHKSHGVFGLFKKLVGLFN